MCANSYAKLMRMVDKMHNDYVLVQCLRATTSKILTCDSFSVIPKNFLRKKVNCDFIPGPGQTDKGKTLFGGLCLLGYIGN